MRRFIAAAAVAAAALTGAAQAAAPLFDSAQGAGRYNARGCSILVPQGRELVCFPQTDRIREFSFSAKQLGLGGRANGIYTQERADGTGGRFAGRVTCLNVLSETAVFGGVVTEAPTPQPGFPSAVGEPFIVWVVDNGPAGSTPPDLISPFAILPRDDPDRPLVPQGFPNVCPQPFPSLYGYFPLNDGNIVVDDQSRPGVQLP